MLTMLAAPATGLAQVLPAASCDAVCRAPASETLPECPNCGSESACWELHSNDRPAFDVCDANYRRCGYFQHECEDAKAAGLRSRDRCAASGRPMDTCCPEDCAHPPPPPEPEVYSRRTWWFFDLIEAGIVRHVPGDTSAQFATGAMLEWLFGATSRRADQRPIRLGPFVSATGNFGRHVRAGGELAGGLSLFVGAKEKLSFSWLVSGGALLDLRRESANRMGGLARISAGGTTDGRRAWKMLSVWLYLEGHWIPGGGGEGARQEYLLGLRFSPLFMIAPWGDPDPS
jgi:hypothetical protein